jgi:tricarballylate dehydrogenase
MDGVDANGFLAEIDAYNQAVNQRRSFDPNVKDGINMQGFAANKSSWANTVDEPPFEACQVGCGITFTFGGLRIEADTPAVVNNNESIPGLYAAGELVGGIFCFNYPGVLGRCWARCLGDLQATLRQFVNLV